MMYEFLLKVAAIAPIAIPLAAIVAIYGIKLQKKEKKLEKSLEFSQEISQHPTFNESFKTLLYLITNRLETPLSNFASEHRTSDEAYAIRVVLNEFERMAAGIKYNVFDDDFLFSSHSSTVLNVHLYLQPYIQEARKVNSLYYVNLDRLCLNWQIRKQKMKR